MLYYFKSGNFFLLLCSFFLHVTQKKWPCFLEVLHFQGYTILVISHILVQNGLHVEFELGLYSINPVVVQTHIIKLRSLHEKMLIEINSIGGQTSGNGHANQRQMDLGPLMLDKEWVI